MEPQSQPALDQSLTDAEYERLAEILDGFPGNEAMDLEELDGFFAALICGPVTVLPSEYLEEIWGNEETPFDAIEDFQEFLNLSMRHWNSIARELESRDLVYIPWLEAEEGEETPRGNLWAQGFMRGVDLCREEWAEISENEDRFAMLFPILALVHENDPDPETRTWKTKPDKELRERVLIGVAAAVQRLHDHFRGRRIQEVRRERSGARTAGRRIGRNDPCFCGSGKKYKRCCGNVAVQ